MRSAARIDAESPSDQSAHWTRVSGRSATTPHTASARAPTTISPRAGLAPPPASAARRPRRPALGGGAPPERRGRGARGDRGGGGAAHQRLTVDDEELLGLSEPTGFAR